MWHGLFREILCGILSSFQCGGHMVGLCVGLSSHSSCQKYHLSEEHWFIWIEICQQPLRGNQTPGPLLQATCFPPPTRKASAPHLSVTLFLFVISGLSLAWNFLPPQPAENRSTVPCSSSIFLTGEWTWLIYLLQRVPSLRLPPHGHMCPAVLLGAHRTGQDTSVMTGPRDWGALRGTWDVAGKARDQLYGNQAHQWGGPGHWHSLASVQEGCPWVRLPTTSRPGPTRVVPGSRRYRFCRTVTNSVSRSRSTSAACQRALNSVTCVCQPFWSGESKNLGTRVGAEVS